MSAGASFCPARSTRRSPISNRRSVSARMNPASPYGTGESGSCQAAAVGDTTRRSACARKGAQRECPAAVRPCLSRRCLRASRATPGGSTKNSPTRTVEHELCQPGPGQEIELVRQSENPGLCRGHLFSRPAPRRDAAGMTGAYRCAATRARYRCRGSAREWRPAGSRSCSASRRAAGRRNAAETGAAFGYDAGPPASETTR